MFYKPIPIHRYSFIDKPHNFKFGPNDVFTVVLDMDNHIGKFINETTKKCLKFTTPKRELAIGFYCNKGEITVTKQIFDRTKYSSSF